MVVEKWTLIKSCRRFSNFFTKLLNHENEVKFKIVDWLASSYHELGLAWVKQLQRYKAYNKVYATARE